MKKTKTKIDSKYKTNKLTNFKDYQKSKSNKNKDNNISAKWDNQAWKK